MKRDEADAQERAHQIQERAAVQFVKLLGTILGGLGVVLAAWLQRIFENPEAALLHKLMWPLASALLFVAGGLVLLAATALLDQWSARLLADAASADKARASRIDRCSWWVRLLVLLCLVSAFATLARGVLSTAHRGTGNAVEDPGAVHGTGTITHNPKP